MIRALVAIMLFAAALTVPANAQLPLLGYGPGSFGGGGGATHSDLLLEDGASFLLLEDGTSKLCLESGC